MVAKLVLTYRDNTLESSRATFQGPELTAGNIVAQEALQDTLITATAGLVNGSLYQTTRIASVEEGSSARPAKDVQREIKLMVRWHAGSEKHRTELPTFDLSTIVDGTEYVDMTAGAGLAFVNAFEAYVTGDDGITAATVDSLTYVNRNT